MTLHSVIGTDQVQDWRVSRSGRIATDQKAVQRRGPGRVALGSKPQLATTKKLVRWAGDSTQARSLRLQKNSCAGLQTIEMLWSMSSANRLLGIMAWTPLLASTTWVMRKLTAMLASA